MKVRKTTTEGKVYMAGKGTEHIEEFCYLGRVMTFEGGCDKNIHTKIGKANTTFGMMNNISSHRGHPLHQTTGQIMPRNCIEHATLWSREGADDSG